GAGFNEAVTKLLHLARNIFLRPLKRAGEVLVMLCTPVWRLGLSYAARERGLKATLACRDSRNRFWLETSSYARSSGLERTGECCQPQSGDWGYPMPPASAG